MRSPAIRIWRGGIHRDRQRAFTLLEIIIVIALIGLLSALVVGGSVALLRDRPATGEDEIRAQVSRCRRKAVSGLIEIRLSFDAKAGVFVARSAQGEARIPVEVPGPFSVEFLSPEADSSSLIGGDVVQNGTLPHVVFYADGACSPFRVQLRTGGPARVMRFDPWTCAEIKESAR